MTLNDGVSATEAPKRGSVRCASAPLTALVGDIDPTPSGQERPVEPVAPSGGEAGL